MEIYTPKGPRGRRKFPGWKRLLGLASLLAAAAVVVWAVWPAPPPPPKPAPPETEARMETMALTEIQEGDKRWTLEGKTADFLKDRQEIKITDVRVEFYGGPNQVIKVKAQEGLIHTETRVLNLRGKVEMVSGDLRVTSEAATYQPVGRLLLVPDDVTIEDPRGKVQGKDLKVYLAEKRLVLAQHRLTQVKVQGMERKR
jgi:LPS export ABC transporter protein LptC